MHRGDGLRGRNAECPCAAGESDLSRVRSAPSRRTSRGCNYLMLFRCGRRCSMSRVWCRMPGWSRRWPGRPGRSGRAGRPSCDGARRRGHAAGLKVSALVAGMVAGADSIADMAVLRHGGMGRLFTGVRAPSTLGTFLRSFRFGHVRQLDAVATRFLTGLARHAPIISTGERSRSSISTTPSGRPTATPSRAPVTATPASRD